MIPVLASLGPFQIYSYGLAIASGVFAALILMQHLALRDGFPPADQMYDLVFFTLVTGFLGARLFYVVQHAAWYREHPLEILAFWQGGLIFYGGMIVSFAGLWFYCRRKKIPFLALLDFLTPFVAFVHAFGRLGCFLNGCCYGNPSRLPWAVQFPALPQPVHPVQLYEMVFNLGLFFVLRGLYAKKPAMGRVTAAYFFFYAAGRLMLEAFRNQENPGWLLTWNQWISLGVLLAAGVFYAALRPRPRP